MNVLNVQDIERELRNIAARLFHAEARRWFSTVARNYILNLSEDVSEEYTEYTKKRPKQGIHTDLPDPEKLPDWAKKALETKTTVHFFNVTQPRRRHLWKQIEIIADWFNTWKSSDPALGRLDRMSFPEANAQAGAWRKNIDENPWLHIKDRPPVYKNYGDGMCWVMLKTDAHTSREGTLMGHCINGRGYVEAMKNGTSEFYSLRDAKNEPHCTVEVRIVNMEKGTERHVIQAKGKQNAKPVAKYQPYLRDLVTQPGWHVMGDKNYVDL